MADIVDHPRASERVKSALHAGYYAACDGLAALSWFRFTPDPRQGQYHNLTMRAGDREVQVSVSPTGRKVRVFVDGQEVKQVRQIDGDGGGNG